MRQLFTGLTTALGAEGSVPPTAEVTITDPAWVDTVFVSPPPVDLGDYRRSPTPRPQTG